MPKKNSKNNLENFLIQIKNNENLKPYFGWFSLILATLFFVSIISKTGIITSIIQKNIFFIFGWNSYLLFLIFIYLGIILILKISWKDFFKKFIGVIIFFLFFDFYFHFFFREGGILGDFLFYFKNYLGTSGSIFISFIFFFFALWLILDDKFINFIKFIFENSKEKIEEIDKKLNKEAYLENPIKPIKKTITTTTVNTDNQKTKIKKVIPKSIWKLPPLNLLNQGKEEVLAPDLKTTSQIIEKTLANFDIKVEVVDVEVGPAITRFNIKPGEGVKLSKILSYQSDLALALGTPNLIIETPIPGKSVLGIQVPNKKPATVKLGNLVQDKEFINGGLFVFPVGRKINGEILFADLAKMPHLLIAGTTGSGKSIFIHDILVSLLLKNTPESLNLILIDPKRVELTHYFDLPHLIMEPVVDVKKTLGVFNWLIEEMEERYKLLQEVKTRDIDSYNEKQIAKKEKIMPRIILVIDELADLMVTYGSNIEAMIIRLTQMARATGIHLILATQRPSVDIITGLIKANIPNRICFKVASYVDSRTVLDISGAEKLIGSGDGLFISTQLQRPIRIKAPFVQDNEIHKIVNFWAEQAEEISFEKQLIPLEEIEQKVITLNEDTEDEELFKTAVKIVIEAGKASTSLLQRRLKIGYARAARLLDLMEEKGIIGPQEGSKPRKVLITLEQFQNIDEKNS
jgi:S-DNA-T family DNA segregation ATPase FtsK/SpoIIIE